MGVAKQHIREVERRGKIMANATGRRGKDRYFLAGKVGVIDRDTCDAIAIDGETMIELHLRFFADYLLKVIAIYWL